MFLVVDTSRAASCKAVATHAASPSTSGGCLHSEEIPSLSSDAAC